MSFGEARRRMTCGTVPQVDASFGRLSLEAYGAQALTNLSRRPWYRRRMSADAVLRSVQGHCAGMLDRAEHARVHVGLEPPEGIHHLPVATIAPARHPVML